MAPVPEQARDTSTNTNTVSVASHSRPRSCPPHSLLGLPPELRHQILQDLFTNISIHITWRTTRHDTEWQHQLAVLATCRLLHVESIAVLQANLTLTVTEEPARGNKHVPARIPLPALPKAIANNVHTFISHTAPQPRFQSYLDLFPAAKRIELWTHIALQHLSKKPWLHAGKLVIEMETAAEEVRRFFCGGRDEDTALYEQFEQWTLGDWGWNQEGCVWQTTRLRRHQWRELLRPLRRTHRRRCWRPPSPRRECEFRVLFELALREGTANSAGVVHFAMEIDPIQQCIADRYVLFQLCGKREIRNTWIAAREVLLVDGGLRDVWEGELAGLVGSVHGLPEHILWAPGYGLLHALDQIAWHAPEELSRILEDEGAVEMLRASAVRCG